MATPTDQQVLTLAQWFSPAYPVGSFAYSHGLEWEVERGTVTTAQDLADWLEVQLRHGMGWNDALFLAAAHRAAPAALSEIDDLCRAFCAGRERQQETLQQGAAFCKITSALHPLALADLCYPVAVGHAAALLDLPLALTLQMYLHAALSNLAGAGMRLIPLGQSDGQRVIRDLTPLCQEIAKTAQVASLEELSATAFLGDIAAMKHETQYSRSFRT